MRRLSLHSLPSMPSVWHAAHLRVSHIQGLHPCVPSPPRHNALAAAHRPRALASALRLQPRCAQSAPLASPHLPPPLVQVMILGTLTTFSLAFSTPVPRLSSSTTRGASFRPRACCFGLGRALATLRASQGGSGDSEPARSRGSPAQARNFWRFYIPEGQKHGNAGPSQGQGHSKAYDSEIPVYRLLIYGR